MWMCEGPDMGGEPEMCRLCGRELSTDDGPDICCVCEDEENGADEMRDDASEKMERRWDNDGADY